MVAPAVVINYASSKDGADRVVADIKAKGAKAIAVQGDVAKAADSALRVPRRSRRTTAPFSLKPSYWLTGIVSFSDAPKRDLMNRGIEMQ